MPPIIGGILIICELYLNKFYKIFFVKINKYGIMVIQVFWTPYTSKVPYYRALLIFKMLSTMPFCPPGDHLCWSRWTKVVVFRKFFRTRRNFLTTVPVHITTNCIYISFIVENYNNLCYTHFKRRIQWTYKKFITKNMRS